MGDVDGDGREEIIIGTYHPSANPSSGSLYVFDLDGAQKQAIDPRLPVFETANVQVNKAVVIEVAPASASRDALGQLRQFEFQEIRSADIAVKPQTRPGEEVRQPVIVKVACHHGAHFGEFGKTFAEIVLPDRARGAEIDRETITLSETGLDTGIFTACLPSNTGTVTTNNGAMNIITGAALAAAYTDRSAR